MTRSTWRRAGTGRAPVSGQALLAAAVWLFAGAVGACDPGQRDSRASGTDTALGSIAPASTDSGAGRADAPRPAALDYVITEERYRRWVAAQRVLDTLPGLPPPPAVDADHVTEGDIARAVAYLERDPRVQAVFRQAGLDAREYVMTTIALDQALVMSTRPTHARYRGVPRSNLDIVAGHREDLEGLRGAARYRIAQHTTDTSGAASTARDTATGDTAADTGAADSGAAGGAAKVIAAGTTVTLRIDARVCTSTHKVGDRITATVATPIAGANGATVPAGATAILTVTRFERGQSAAEASAIDFRLSSLAFGGQVYPIEGAVASVQLERARGQPAGAGATTGTAGTPAANAECVPGGARIPITLRNPLRLRA